MIQDMKEQRDKICSRGRRGYNFLLFDGLVVGSSGLLLVKPPLATTNQVGILKLVSSVSSLGTIASHVCLQKYGCVVCVCVGAHNTELSTEDLFFT
jgi:hypothetical protein